MYNIFLKSLINCYHYVLIINIDYCVDTKFLQIQLFLRYFFRYNPLISKALIVPANI